jgi:DNA-binding SARP family transcriptional activator/tetratricopeptide (TPR) repeat protein
MIYEPIGLGGPHGRIGVEFGLLGPLVVRAGGSRVMVSAGKQRVLLAALLLRANQVVGPGELAEAVWEGRPPETARVTLQNYVKRLRQALAPAGYERIVTRPAGYLIEIGPGELDVARFAELQSAASRAARSGAWDVVSGRLGEALGLWRGRPLADVPSRVLAAGAVPRLVEMRLEALEARIEADLHLGRHREVVAEVQALAAAEPLRERLAELLMLALYRSGQQASALAAYQQVWRHLVEQIGIEPGPGLRDLNQRILRSDASLLPAQPAQPARPADRKRPGPRDPVVKVPAPAAPADGDRARLPAPVMLPAAVPGFTGRSRELRALSGLVRRPGGPVLITAIGGTAGVGKTALAVHWARRAAADFPDGQLYVNLRGFGPADPLPPAEALRAFLDALGVPAARIPATLEGRQALYRSLLEGRRMLVVLDNALDPAQVRPLLPATATAMVLITSRSELAGLVASDGARTLGLDVLSGTEAYQLIAGRLGEPRIAAEPEAADELIGLCARLPLALAITAARAVAHPTFTLAALVAELRDAKGRLDALSTGEDATDVRAVLSWSYQSLQPPAARMFRLLGLHPGPEITAAAAASLAGTGLPEARRLLRELTRCHLLAEPAAGRYAFHDLLRAYAAEQAAVLDSDDDRQAATGRMLDHYLHSARAADLQLNPLREPITRIPPPPLRGVTPETTGSRQRALAWFEAEQQVLLAAINLAAETGFDVHAWQLPWAMVDFLDIRGQWRESAATQRCAVAAATRSGDVAGQAAANRLLARACAMLGDYDQARVHLADCLGLYRQLDDRSGEARTHQSLSWIAERQLAYADALGHSEQALDLFRATGNRAGQASALNSVGWCHALLGDPQQARRYCRQALALHQELSDRHGEAHTWDSLGYAERQLGRLATATTCYQHALRIFRELGARYNEADTLANIGDTRHADGNRDQAKVAWQKALAILDDLEHADAGRVRAKLRQLGTAGRAQLASQRLA